MKIFLTAFLTAISVLFLQNVVIPLLPKDLVAIKKAFAQTASTWNIKRDTDNTLKFYFGATQPAISPLNITSAGEIKNSNFPIYGFAGSAVQNTGHLTALGGTWIDITGASVSVTLPKTMTVKMRGHGSVTGVGDSSHTGGHCGFRFAVDSTPYGDASWGDQIVGCSTSGSISWWCPWNIERETSLGAGNHTIKLQMAGWVGTGAGCRSENTDYSRARLWVEAR